jgi:hypothetical protein
MPVNSNFSTAQEKKTLRDWRTENLLVTSWLLKSMVIVDIYMCAGSAQAIWQKLERRFGQKEQPYKNISTPNRTTSSKKTTNPNNHRVAQLHRKK